MNICQQLILLLPVNLCTIPVFYLGSGLGLISAAIGGAVEYRRMLVRRRRGDQEEHLPGCMIMVGGALGFAGAVVLTVSIFTGHFRDAMILGWGVGGGFILGFFTLVGVWALFFQEDEQDSEASAPASQDEIVEAPQLTQNHQLPD